MTLLLAGAIGCGLLLAAGMAWADPQAAHAAHGVLASAGHAGEHEALPEALAPQDVSWVRALLVGSLWLFIAAMVLGPAGKTVLAKRKSPQVFADDTASGGHGDHDGAHAAAHH